MSMTDEELRELAGKRVKEKREFWQHLVAYVVVNAALIGVWAINGGGYFWPGWVLLGWGIGIFFHGWNAFFSRPVTDEDIDREMRKLSEKR